MMALQTGPMDVKIWFDVENVFLSSMNALHSVRIIWSTVTVTHVKHIGESSLDIK